MKFIVKIEFLIASFACRDYNNDRFLNFFRFDKIGWLHDSSFKFGLRRCFLRMTVIESLKFIIITVFFIVYFEVRIFHEFVVFIFFSIGGLSESFVFSLKVSLWILISWTLIIAIVELIFGVFAHISVDIIILVERRHYCLNIRGLRWCHHEDFSLKMKWKIKREKKNEKKKFDFFFDGTYCWFRWYCCCWSLFENDLLPICFLLYFGYAAREPALKNEK